MKDPLGVSPSKGNQGTTRGKEKISVGIEPTTSGFTHDLKIRYYAVFKLTMGSLSLRFSVYNVFRSVLNLTKLKLCKM